MAMLKWKIWAIVVILSVLLCLGASGTAHSGGTMIDLGTLPGGTYSYATAINDKGQVVGYSSPDINRAPADTHAFLYSDGKMIDLGTLGGRPSDSSEAYGINNSSQIIGYSITADYQHHAFLYSSGKMTDLGALEESSYSEATAINDKGQVVGYSNTRVAYQGHAFLYTPASHSLPAILSLLLGD